MPTDEKPPRWGVRTLAFLALTLLAMAVSTLQGHYTLLTLAGLIVGLVGATVSTARGVALFLK